MSKLPFKNSFILSIAATIAVSGFFVATPALAASTFSLSPSNISITRGQSFDMTIRIDPAGLKNYTVKTGLQYPSDMLEVKHFAFGAGWMALSQSGYDLIDNKNGVLIKTAGYPSGFSENKIFGVVSFSAKKTGSGIIEIKDNSLVLDQRNQNVLGSFLSKAFFTIKAPSSEKIIPKNEISPTPAEETTPSSAEEISSSPRPLFDILTGPAVEPTKKGPLITYLIIAGIIVLMIVASVIIYKKYRKKKRKLL